MVAYHVFAYQTITLLSFIAWHVCVVMLTLPVALLRNLLLSCCRRKDICGDDGCVFFEGLVTHERRAPVKHQFRWSVDVVPLLI